MKLTDDKFIKSSAVKSEKYSVDDLKSSVGSNADKLFDKIANEVFQPQLGQTAEMPHEKKPKYPGMWSKAKISRFFRNLRSSGVSSKDKAVATAIAEGAAGNGGKDDAKVTSFLEAMWDRSVSVTAYRDLYAGLSADSLSSEEKEGTTVEAQAMDLAQLMGGPGGAPGAPPAPPDMAAQPGQDADKPEEEVDNPSALDDKLQKIEDLVDDAREQIEKSSPPPSDTGSIPGPAPKVVGASVYRRIGQKKEDEDPSDVNKDSPDDEAPSEVELGSGWVGDPDSAHGSQRVPTTTQPSNIGESAPGTGPKSKPVPSPKDRIYNPATGTFPVLHKSPAENTGIVHLEEGVLPGPDTKDLSLADIKAPSYNSKGEADSADVSVRNEKADALKQQIDDKLTANPGLRKTIEGFASRGPTREKGIESGLVEMIEKDADPGQIKAVEDILNLERAITKLNKSNRNIAPEKRVHQSPGGFTDFNITTLGQDPAIKAKELAPNPTEYSGSDVKLKPSSKGGFIKPLSGMSRQQIRDEFDRAIVDYAKQYEKMTGEKLSLEDTRAKPHGPSGLFDRPNQESINKQKVDKLFDARDKIGGQMREVSGKIDALSDDSSPEAATQRKSLQDEMERLRDSLNTAYATSPVIEEKRNKYSLLTAAINGLNAERTELELDKEPGYKERILEIDEELKSKQEELSSLGADAKIAHDATRPIILNAKLRKKEYEDEYKRLKLALEEESSDVGDLSPEGGEVIDSKIGDITSKMRHLRAQIDLQDEIIGTSDSEQKRKELIQQADRQISLAHKARRGLDSRLNRYDIDATSLQQEIDYLKQKKERIESGEEKLMPEEARYHVNTPEYSALRQQANDARKSVPEYMNSLRRKLEKIEGEIKSAQSSVGGTEPTSEQQDLIGGLSRDRDLAIRAIQKAEHAWQNPIKTVVETDISKIIKGKQHELEQELQDQTERAATKAEYDAAIELAKQQKKDAAGEVSVMSDPVTYAEVHERPYYRKLSKQISGDIVATLYSGPVSDYAVAHQMAYNYFQEPENQKAAEILVEVEKLNTKIENLKTALQKSTGKSYDESMGEMSKNPQALKIRQMLTELGNARAKLNNQLKTTDKSQLVNALATHMTSKNGMRKPFKYNGGVVTAEDIGNGVGKLNEDVNVMVAALMKFETLPYVAASTGRDKYKPMPKRDKAILLDVPAGAESEENVKNQAKEREANEIKNKIERMRGSYDSIVSAAKKKNLSVDGLIAALNEQMESETDPDKRKGVQDTIDRVSRVDSEYRALSESLKKITTNPGYMEYRKSQSSDSDGSLDVSQQIKPQKDLSGRTLGEQYYSTFRPDHRMFIDGTGKPRRMEIGMGPQPMLIDALPIVTPQDRDGNEITYIINGMHVPAPSVENYNKLMAKLHTKNTDVFKRDINGNVKRIPIHKFADQPVLDEDGKQMMDKSGKPMVARVQLPEFERNPDGSVKYENGITGIQTIDMAKIKPEDVAAMKMYLAIFGEINDAQRKGVLLGIRASGKGSKKTTTEGKRTKNEGKRPKDVKPEPDVKTDVPKKDKKIVAPKHRMPFKKGSDKSDSEKTAVDEDSKKYYKKLFPGQYGKQMGETKAPMKKVKKKSDRLADVVDSVETVFNEFGISDNARIASIAEFVADNTKVMKYADLSAVADSDSQFGKSVYKLVASHIVKHNADRPFGATMPSIIKDAIISAALSESGLEDKVMNYVAQKMKVPKVNTKSEDAVEVDEMKDEAKKSKPTNRSYGIEFNVDDMYKQGYYVHMVISWDPDEYDANKSLDGMKQAVRSYVKGLESAKEFHNIGFLGQIEFKDIDVEAGVAEVYFKTRVDGDAIQTYRDVPKSKSKSK